MRVKLQWLGCKDDSDGLLALLKSIGVSIADHSSAAKGPNREKHNLTADFPCFAHPKPPKPEPEPAPKQEAKPLPKNLYVIYHLNRAVLVAMDETKALEIIGMLQSQQAAVYRRTGYEALPFNLSPREAFDFLERERLGDEEWQRRYKD